MRLIELNQLERIEAHLAGLLSRTLVAEGAPRRGSSQELVAAGGRARGERVAERWSAAAGATVGAYGAGIVGRAAVEEAPVGGATVEGLGLWSVSEGAGSGEKAGVEKGFGGETVCVGPMTEVLRAYVMAGGKRVRPQLCVWAYERCVGGVGAAGADEIPEAVLDLACAWELFHSFLLAHDDIIDRGDMRRSRPSLHRQLATLDSGSEVFGMNLAIVGGDLLYTAAMQLLHELDLPAKPYRDILRLFTRVAATTGFGQAIDIVQGHVPMDAVEEAELLREYHWKTAAYTFEGPMVSGAMAAGAGAAVIGALSRFSLAIGQAYQLQNDLIDLASPTTEGSDLVQGKRTVTLLRAREMCPAEERAAFDARVARAAGGTAAGLEEAEQLRLELRACGAVAATEGLVSALLAEAEEATRAEGIPERLAAGMVELLEGMQRSYFR